MLATETTQNFHSYKKRKEKEGVEKVGNQRSDRQPSTSYMKSPDESRSPEVGIWILQFLSAKSLTRIGAWNVGLRTVYVTGRLTQLLREIRLYKLQILGVNEMRWTGRGRMASEGAMIIYSGGRWHERGLINYYSLA